MRFHCTERHDMDVRPSPLAAAPAPASPTFSRLFDFPGFAAGDTFTMAKGSTANGFGIGGNARLDEFTPTSARLWIKGGKFGFNQEATVDLRQTSPTTAHLIAERPNEEPFHVDTAIVDARRGYTELRPTSVRANNATMQTDPTGNLVFDFEDVQKGYRFHLILAKQAAKDAIA
jgi:hypothetical protein